MDSDENKGPRSQERTKWGIIGDRLNYLTVFMSKYTLFHYTTFASNSVQKKKFITCVSL